MFWFCQSKRLFMTPFPHVAWNKQIVQPGKWPATESFLFYTVFTQIEMTCTFASKSQRGPSKSKAEVCYPLIIPRSIIPPCKHTIKGCVESSSAFLHLLDMCYFYKSGINQPPAFQNLGQPIRHHVQKMLRC